MKIVAGILLFFAIAVIGCLVYSTPRVEDVIRNEMVRIEGACIKNGYTSKECQYLRGVLSPR